jgi:hypothetical protein
MSQRIPKWWRENPGLKYVLLGAALFGIGLLVATFLWRTGGIVLLTGGLLLAILYQFPGDWKRDPLPVRLLKRRRQQS